MGKIDGDAGTVSTTCKYTGKRQSEVRPKALRDIHPLLRS